MSITAFNAIVSRPWGDPPVYILPNEANYQEVLGFLHEDQGETLTVAAFSDILEEQPALLKVLATAPAGVMIDSRSVFDQWCRAHGYSQNDANWKLVEDYVPFYEHRLLVSLERGDFHLAKLSEQEQAQLAQEQHAAAVEKYNDWLANKATIPQLKQCVREEKVELATQARDQRDQEHLAAAEARQAGQYQPLPATWNGEVLDAAFIRRCSPAVHKILNQRFGSYQLDLRLRGSA